VVTPPGGDPYAIVLAEARHLDGLNAIELAAAAQLAGHAPPPVLEGVTPRGVLDAATVGFAHVEPLAADAPHLEEIDVHPSHGRRGLGTRLVQAVCDWAAAAGHRAITLTTFRHVPWNMPWYRRLGFAELPAEAWSDAMRRQVASETARGLDPSRRLVMVRRLQPVVTAWTVARVARPTDRLEEVVAFYADGLGLARLGGFLDHDGFDGVMLGPPGGTWHVEFTRRRRHAAAGRAPSAEHVLVLYLPDRAAWQAAVDRLIAAGHRPIAPVNPYWARSALTFADPEGYGVVLQHGPWPVPVPAS
jgi:GNAT superfamily N-acetyltransferase